MEDRVNLMKVLKGYDMVLALSIAEINNQLSALCEQEIIKKNWTHEFTIFRSFKANIKASIEKLEISVLKKNFSQVLFTVLFGADSKLTIADEVTPLEGCKYAFVVNIGQLEYRVEDIIDCQETTLITKAANDKVIEIIKDSKIPYDRFTVQCLFLDFQNANIANYSTKESNIENFIKNDFTTFVIALTKYFKDFANEKNPYVLGYNLTILPRLSETEKAVFEPTYCTFSTSYDEGKMQALNFLMMTNNHIQPQSQSAGILEKSLISAKGYDGVLAINFPLFKEKILQSISETVKQVLSKIINNKINLKEISLFKEENKFWMSKKIKVEPSYRNGDFKSSDTSYKIETNSPWNINIKANTDGIGLGSTVKENFTENVDISVTLDVVDTKDKLEIIVELLIDCKQEFQRSGAVASGGAVAVIGFSDKGYLKNQKKPSSVSIVITAGTEGRLSVDVSNFTEGEFEKKSIDVSFDKSLDQNLGIINTSLQELAKAMYQQLNSELNKYFSAKVILPLGNIYTFKNIRLYEETEKLDAENNAVVCDITYEPKHLPVKEN